MLQSIDQPSAIWPNCEGYITKIRTASANIGNSKEIIAIVNLEMANLKSDFIRRVKVLYDRYLGKLRDASAPAWLIQEVVYDKDEDLKNIAYQTSVSVDDIRSVYNRETIDEVEILAFTWTLCDIPAQTLWKMIGERDQQTKKRLAKEHGLLTPNRIKMEVEVTVPDSFETDVSKEVHAAIAGGAKGTSDLWLTAGRKVAADFMQKEKARVKGIFQIFQNYITHRVERTRSNPNELIDKFFHKFIREIEEFDGKIDGDFDGQFKQLELEECRFNEKENDNPLTTGCLKAKANYVASNMETYAEDVVKLTVMLNYLLESVNQ